MFHLSSMLLLLVFWAESERSKSRQEYGIYNDPEVSQRVPNRSQGISALNSRFIETLLASEAAIVDLGIGWATVEWDVVEDDVGRRNSDKGQRNGTLHDALTAFGSQ
jgi:hypothetical protein